jgi:hypothetical protein
LRAGMGITDQNTFGLALIENIQLHDSQAIPAHMVTFCKQSAVNASNCIDLFVDLRSKLLRNVLQETVDQCRQTPRRLPCGRWASAFRSEFATASPELWLRRLDSPGCQCILTN